MITRRAAEAAATRRRYFRNGGAALVVGIVVAGVAGFPFGLHSAGAPMKRLAGQVDRDGHCYFDAVANGDAHFRMMLDSGSTKVLLYSQHMAGLGLRASALRYDNPVSTVNGIAFVAPLTLRELRLGDYVMRDVAASVMKSSKDHPDNDEPLLGLSGLKGLHVELGNGACTLLWQ